VVPTVLQPVSIYWCGFDEEGNEKWYIKFNTGKIISSSEPEYLKWIKKYPW
jgi:hypothetical protein